MAVPEIRLAEKRANWHVLPASAGMPSSRGTIPCASAKSVPRASWDASRRVFAGRNLHIYGVARPTFEPPIVWVKPSTGLKVKSVIGRSRGRGGKSRARVKKSSQIQLGLRLKEPSCTPPLVLAPQVLNQAELANAREACRVSVGGPFPFAQLASFSSRPNPAILDGGHERALPLLRPPRVAGKSQ